MREFLDRQYKHKFLWMPFMMAFGAALYFSLPSEPNIQYPLLIGAVIALVLLFRKTGLFAFILLFMFGFLYANGFTKLIDTPQLGYNLRNVELVGTVTNIDYTSKKTRLFLSVPASVLNKKITENKTANIRVSVNDGLDIPPIGSEIKATVTLFRPSGASAPGAFDYANWAYFNGLSATGYLISYTVENKTVDKTNNINTLRDYIHARTNSFLSDTLVLGYKNAVSDDDNQIWKATGVGHVWSISGFHMTLVGGWLFVFFYLVFRSIPPITRNFPARYPAIICAWTGLLFYLFLSGTDVATVRAFLMTSLMFVAFLFGRTVFSLRNVCLVFGAIFLINPYYIMQPGFQLSFAAIFGLVWYFNDYQYTKTSVIKKILNIVKAATITSILATVFTAAFVAYHFYSLPIYGLIGNLILLPVFSFAIMPLVLIGTLTALFGFTLPLIWCNDIYNWTLIVAQKIADLPFAQIQIPHISGTALFLITLGFLCLMFIQNADREEIASRFAKHANIILFTIFISAGISIIAFSKRPLFYATNDHELVGFVNDDRVEFNQKSASNHYFAFESWRLLNFEKPSETNYKYRCEKGVCKYKTKNWNLVYIQKYVPLSRNIAQLCRDDNVDFIVSYFKIDAPKCNHKIPQGGFVIYENGKIKHTPSGRLWH